MLTLEVYRRKLFIKSALLSRLANLKIRGQEGYLEILTFGLKSMLGNVIMPLTYICFNLSVYSGWHVDDTRHKICPFTLFSYF